MTIYCYLHHPPWIWKSHYSSAFAQSIVCISYRICQVLTYLGNLSLYMADNLNVAFFGKILSNMSWHLPQKGISIRFGITMTDWVHYENKFTKTF